MKIDDLLNQAYRIDPNVHYEIADQIFYAQGKKPERHTSTTSIHSTVYGEGSHEAIELTMRNDQVVGIIPGRTTQYWQAHPLVEALSRNTPLAE